MSKSPKVAGSSPHVSVCAAIPLAAKGIDVTLGEPFPADVGGSNDCLKALDDRTSFSLRLTVVLGSERHLQFPFPDSRA